ncbi:FUSC family protein [Vibrio gangliei]|uniref:FUSC family protein n=1 Tax=Vibrio gangliei TaxID=2077090 RepID=UPI000D014343|nr:FUSC family protein [Vibrio gangliei]
MTFQWLDIRQTPWGRATAPQWRYALRNSIAIILALYIGFVLELDKPYWAMTSAAVVGFPTFGGVISKSLGRIVGSFIGAFASILIVGYSINEPWLFVFYMAMWLSICTYVASHFENNVAYAFALSGYTAAIISYGMVNTTDIHTLFTVAQARVCEVVLGIVCAGVMMMILPSTSDGQTLLSTLRNTQNRLLEHFNLLLQSDHPNQETIGQSHHSMINQILSMNLLRIQAFWTHKQLREQDPYLHHVLQQQLSITSSMSSLRRMLLNWPEAPQEIKETLLELQTFLASANVNQYELCKILATIRPQEQHDYKYHAFWLRLREFCKAFLRTEQILQGLENGTKTGVIQLGVMPKRSRVRRHTDSIEALLNAFRTFSCLMLVSVFWIESNWSMGYGAAMLAGVSCVLFATYPVAKPAMLAQTNALVALFVVCFFLKFGLMVQVSEFVQFAVVIFVFLITAHLLRLQYPKQGAFWALLVVMLGSFMMITNPPTYDFGTYLNSGIAMLIGSIVPIFAFGIIKPSSDRRKGLRIAKFLRMSMVYQLSENGKIDGAEFEGLVFDGINRLSQSQDKDTRIGLLRLGIVILNCHSIVERLRQQHNEEARLVLTEVTHYLTVVFKNIRIRQAYFKSHDWHFHYQQDEGILTDSLQHIQVLGEQLARSGEVKLAGLIWRLHCSLLPLQQIKLNKEVTEMELSTQ